MPLNVVVTGGAGQIAYSLIPLIARGLVFGPGTKVHLRLLDIPHSAKALEGVAMEVQDSLFSSVLEGVFATTDVAQAFDGAQVAIFLGGFPRRPGMERGDLIGKNAGIMKGMGQALEAYANRNCKVIVVANPAPTNCFVLASFAPSLPRENFSCLSRLDQDRMEGMLLHKANRCLGERSSKLSPKDIRGSCVWGNHSNSQVPDASAVEFLVENRWVPAASIIPDHAWLDLPSSAAAAEGGVQGLAEATRARGAAVLAARKLSSAMSAANAIAGHLGDWLRGTEDIPMSPSKVVSMGVVSDGNPFGVPEGIVCSFPVICHGAGEWSFAESFRLTETARLQLNASVAELEEEKAMAMEMLDVVLTSAVANGAPVNTPNKRPIACL